MKILHYDLETSYAIGAVWGMWQTDVVSVLQDPYILGIGYSWEHLEGVYWKGLPDFPLYKKDKLNDHDLVVFICKLFEEADVLVAHNGDQFDIKKVRGRAFLHGLPPIPIKTTIDTKKSSKQFGLMSNKLDELVRQSFGDRKLKHSGIDMWTQCMDKKNYNKKAWDEMSLYCKKDVRLLKRYYAKIKPWISNHPNWNLYKEGPVCPSCGFAGVRKYGFSRTRVTVKQRYMCDRAGCQSTFTGETISSAILR